VIEKKGKKRGRYCKAKSYAFILDPIQKKCANVLSCSLRRSRPRFGGNREGGRRNLKKKEKGAPQKAPVAVRRMKREEKERKEVNHMRRTSTATQKIGGEGVRGEQGIGAKRKKQVTLALKSLNYGGHACVGISALQRGKDEAKRQKSGGKGGPTSSIGSELVSEKDTKAEISHEAAPSISTNEAQE